MSEFDQLYRELILDHYKNPRNHGLLDPADAQAEGQNPLCGDEILVSVRLGVGLRRARLRDQPSGDVDAQRPRERANRR
jgi:NifU-like N terminal domain